MKAYTKSMLVAFAIGAALTSCQPDKVTPKDSASQDGPTMGAMWSDTTHPDVEPFCSDFDTLPLVNEANGGTRINYCGFLPCTGTQPEWGKIIMYNSDDEFVANLSLATGWFIDFNWSEFAVASSFSFTGNGIPITSNDWLANDVNPLVNTYQLIVPRQLIDADLNGCFATAIRLKVVKVGFFNGVDQNSVRYLWARNDDWNNPNSPFASNSPFVTGWCWGQCAPVWPAADTVCVPAWIGLPGNNNCATLTPDVSGAAAPITYAWASGETSASLTACSLTGNTSYRVSVTDANGPFSVTEFNVSTLNADCTPGNRPSPKVKVCHIPPGNPNNPQSICIDWSGVPAHVLRFRTPLMNPNHGHDSGCEIGECNSNPCD